MTDKQVFEKFMSWMGMAVEKSAQLNGIEAFTYEDSYGENAKIDDRFSGIGYESFSAGAAFDKHGNMLRIYLDSHVAYNSENYFKMHEFIKQANRTDI